MLPCACERTRPLAMSLLVALGCAGCWPFDPSLVPGDASVATDAPRDAQSPTDAADAADAADAPDAWMECAPQGTGSIQLTSRVLATAERALGDAALVASGRADGSHDVLLVDRDEPFGALSTSGSRTILGARCSEEDAVIDAPFAGVVATSGEGQQVTSVLPFMRSGTALDYVLARSGGAGVVVWRAAAGYVDRDLARDPLPGTDVAVGDLNEDGRLDLVSFGGVGGSPLRVVLGQPTGWLGSTPVEGAIGVGRAWIVDVDRDGHLDLVTAPETDPVRFPVEGWEGHTPVRAELYLGDGTGALVRSASSNLSGVLGANSSAVLADLDDDGWLDIFQVECPWDAGDATRPPSAPGGNCSAYRLMGSAGARFEQRELRLTEVGARRVGSHAPALASDLDLDGNVDVVLALDELMVLHSEPMTADMWPFVQASAQDLGLGTLALGESPRVLVGELDGQRGEDLIVVDREAAGARRLLSSTSAAPRVLVRLHGREGNPEAIGAELCVYTSGGAPADGACTGSMIAHHVRFATTTQPQAPLIMIALPSSETYTLRVVWPHVDGADDVPSDVEVSASDAGVVEVSLP